MIICNFLWKGGCTANIFPETTVVGASDLPAAPVGPELVMFSVERGKYYGLNEVGAAIWRRMERPITVARLCMELQEAFDVPAEQCWADVSGYLEKLLDKGLIRILPSRP